MPGHAHGSDLIPRSADVALRAVPSPAAVLDVGCGTGELLRLLAERLPGTGELVGVDPDEARIEDGRARLGDGPRVRLEVAAAESLPFPGACFDLVVATGSFHHWADRAAGLREAARVLRDDGTLVLVDRFGADDGELDALLAAAGLERLGSEPVVGDVGAAIVRHGRIPP